MLSITVNTYANSSHLTFGGMPREHGECADAGVIYDRYQVVAELSSAGAKSLGDRDYEAARDMFREGIEVVREIEDMGVPPPTGRAGAKRGKKSRRRSSSPAAGGYRPRNRQEDSLHSSMSSMSLGDEVRGSGGKNEDPCRDDTDRKKAEAKELDQDPLPSSKPESGDCAEDGGIAVQRRPMSVDFVKSPELLGDLCLCGSLLPETVSSALLFNLALTHHLHAMDTGSPSSVHQSLALYQLAKDSLSTSEYISIRQFKHIHCIENLIECRHRLIRAVLGNMFIIYCDCEEFEYAGKVYEELGMIGAVMSLHGLHDGGFGILRNPPT